jgi:hypothetical protein
MLPEVIFFGRLEERKGLVEFLEALGKLLSDGAPRFRVSFVGKVVPLFTEEFRGLDSRSLIESKLNGQVEFAIHADFDSRSAIEYVCKSTRSVVCLTSSSDNFPNAALEMGQCPRRLVVSDTKGFHQTLSLIGRTEGIHWFKPGCSDALAQAIRAALEQGGPLPVVPTAVSIDRLNQQLLQDRINLIDSAFTEKQGRSSGASARIRTALILSPQPPDPRAIRRSLLALAKCHDQPDSILVGSQGLSGAALDAMVSRFPQVMFVDSPIPSLQEMLRAGVGEWGRGDYAVLMIAGAALEPVALGNLARVGTNNCALVVSAESVSTNRSRIRMFEAPSVSMLARANYSGGSCLLVSLPYVESLPSLPVDKPSLAIWLVVLAATAQGRQICYLPLPQLSAPRKPRFVLPGKPADEELTQVWHYLSGLEVQSWSVRELRNLVLSVQQLSLCGFDAKRNPGSQAPSAKSDRFKALVRLVQRLVESFSSAVAHFASLARSTK